MLTEVEGDTEEIVALSDFGLDNDKDSWPASEVAFSRSNLHLDIEAEEGRVDLPLSVF